MSFKGTVLVTGGTVNLGYHAALAIAKARQDLFVVLASRSDHDQAAAKINKSLRAERAAFLQLDLSSLDNVRSFVKQWEQDQRPPIQIMLLNAGLQFPGPLGKTKDGIERTFAVNHVGHALLFHLLLPHLSPTARVVVTASGTHDPAQKSGLPDAKYTSAADLADPPQDMIDINGRQRYSSSKLANVMWTYAIARRIESMPKSQHSGLTINAFDPGLMPGTGLAREGTSVERFIWNHVLPHAIPLLQLLISPNIHKPEESASNLASVALGEHFMEANGKYFERKQIIQSSKDSYDKAKEEDLLSWTIDRVAISDQERGKFGRLD